MEVTTAEDIRMMKDDIRVIREDTDTLTQTIEIMRNDVHYSPGLLLNNEANLGLDIGELRRDVGILREDMSDLRREVGSIVHTLDDVRETQRAMMAALGRLEHQQ